MMEIMAFFSL